MSGSKVHPEDPKDDGSKVPAATYAWMIPVITRVARRHGYAIGVHGSMSRDLDVVAVPWVEDANDPADLVREIAEYLAGTIIAIEQKPHGRQGFTIVFTGAWHFVDLSVMPRKSPTDL